uniref:Uncharacterized protein n=1 Tax=Arundo donax TaxID=35708 RepID=A0A0A8ZY30_ARUDO
MISLMENWMLVDLTMVRLHFFQNVQML